MRTEILYEDKIIMVIRKPAGLAVQSAGIGQPDVVSELKSHLAKLPDTGRLGPGKGEPYLGIVHRLDQPVEGVLVFAKEKKAAAALTKQLSDGTLNKHYYAVLCGYPAVAEGELVDYLRKEGSVAVAVTGREKNFPDAKIAKLHYSILEKINQPMPNGRESGISRRGTLRIFSGFYPSRQRQKDVIPGETAESCI